MATNGFTRSSITSIVPLNVIKLVFSPRGILKLRVLTTITFSPIAKLNTLRCLLTVATTHNWFIHQLDVQNVFLHGDLHEVVYMESSHVLHRQGENLVCQLNKSFYGLKQASRNWFSIFSNTIQKVDYLQPKVDYSLFSKAQGTYFTTILICVNNILLIGNDLQGMERPKQFLLRHLRMKDLGNLKYFLGIEFSRSKKKNFHVPKEICIGYLRRYGTSWCITRQSSNGA